MLFVWLLLLEVALFVLCMILFRHEDRLIRIEHAFAKALVWTVYEKVKKTEVEFEDVAWLHK